MTETKCFRDAFRDQLRELSGKPNIYIYIYICLKEHLRMRGL